MELSLQQRACIKFCVKNGFNGARTLEMLEKCFGNDTLKKTVVYQWHERFRSGREFVDDDERSGRPSTSKTDKNINKVKEMVANNGKLTIRELAEDLNIAYGSVQDILVNDLGFRGVAAKEANITVSEKPQNKKAAGKHAAEAAKSPSKTKKPTKPRALKPKKTPTKAKPAAKKPSAQKKK